MSIRGREARVVCAARLHLGFLDLNFGLGRRFGSIGLALDQPLTRLILRHSEATIVEDSESRRAGQFLAIITDYLGLRGHHSLTVESAIWTHFGLGSGTQLALGVAAAVRAMHGLPRDARADARVLQRGARSGIGIGLFEQGGIVVDGGNGISSNPPPLLSRLAVPESWRVLLVLDRSRKGLSGEREKAAFDALPPMPAAASGELCRLVLMRALPGVAEDDLEAFGAAITRIQEIVGDHFAPAQGSRFTSPAVAQAVAALASAGATGIGQSSWGPTGFAFVRGDAEADRVLALAGAMPDAVNILVCRARNRGADISVEG